VNSNLTMIVVLVPVIHVAVPPTRPTTGRCARPTDAIRAEIDRRSRIMRT
jgi:hypothetical protein